MITTGIGQGGCAFGSQSSNVSKYANPLFNRWSEILTDILAVNTGEADLPVLGR